MTTSSTDSSQASLPVRADTIPALCRSADGARSARDNASQEELQSDTTREDGVLDFDEDTISSPVPSHLLDVLLHPEDVDHVRLIIHPAE